MENKTSDAQIRASQKYNAKATKTILIRLNINNDKDIISHLDKQKSKMGYIKDLIIQDATQPKHYPPTRYSDGTYGCGVCGHELAPGKPKFCSECGKPVDWGK